MTKSVGRGLSVFAVLVSVGLWGATGDAQSSLSVVPGAFGYGMETRAAYGGGGTPQILRVTNLNDSGAGSLRAALEASGPRVVIFEVSGYINLASNIHVTSPYLTVAGQTAPSPGVAVRSVGTFANEAMILVWTHDTLWQHFAIRPGSTTCNSGIQFYDGGGGANNYNNILDHMSISWAQDEGVAFNVGASASTIWRSIIAEVLAGTPGTSGCTGGGTTEGNGIAIGSGNNIAILQSLIAHDRVRTPQIDGGGSGAIQNNVIYGVDNGPIFSAHTARAFYWRIDGNYFRRDTNSYANQFATVSIKAVAGSQLYLANNHFDNSGVLPDWTPFFQSGGVDPRVGAPPISIPGYMPLSATVAYGDVLANAGPRPADRDLVDQRIIANVESRGGRIISVVDAVGGYPPLTQASRSLTVPNDPHQVQASGYTNLELWLHQFARSVEHGEGAAKPGAPLGVRIVGY